MKIPKIEEYRLDYVVIGDGKKAVGRYWFDKTVELKPGDSIVLPFFDPLELSVMSAP